MGLDSLLQERIVLNVKNEEDLGDWW